MEIMAKLKSCVNLKNRFDKQIRRIYFHVQKALVISKLHWNEPIIANVQRENLKLFQTAFSN